MSTCCSPVELLEAVIAVQRRFMAEGDVQRRFGELLQIFLKATESQYGFIGELLPTRKGKRDLKPLAVANLNWDETTHRGAAIRSGRPGMANLPFFSADGEPIGVVGLPSRPDSEVEDLVHRLEPLLSTCGVILAADRKERRRRDDEQAHGDGAQQFNLFMQHLPGLAWIKDHQGRYVYANDAAVLVFGLPWGELKDRTDSEVFPATTARQFQENDQRVLASGEPIETVEILRHADGIEHHSIVRKFPILGPQGDVQFVGGIAIDVTERLRAEAALREAEARYRGIFERAVDGISRVTPEGRFLMANPALAQMLGYDSPEELIASVTDLGRQVYADARQREAARGLLEAAGVLRGFETQVVRKDGQTIWVSINAYVVCNADGRPLYYDGITEDISERKRAQMALAESEARFRQIAETIRDVFWMADLRKPEMIYVSPAYEEVWGRSRQSLYDHPRSFLEAVHPEDQERVRAAVARQFEGESLSKEYRILRPDGTLRWVLDRGFPIRDAEGRVERVTGIAEDITERKLAEEAIRQAGAFRETIIRTAAEGICVCHAGDEHPALVFTVWNDRMAEITGYTLDEINQVDWHVTLFPEPAVRARAVERMVRAMSGDVLKAEEWTIARRDGSQRIVSIATSLIETLEGHRAILALIQDVTDSRRAEEKLALQQAELLHVSRLSAMGQLLATLSHELAQPLSAVGNFTAATLALLRSRTNPGLAEVRQYVEEIAQQSQQAGQIVQRLRDFSRKAPPARERCQVNAVLNESVALVASELRRRGLQVSWEQAHPSPWVIGDRVQLQQVMVNLLTNAAEAMEQTKAGERIVTLRSRREADVIVEVEDRGRGIATEMRSRLFEPFATTKPQGMGIGLSICQTIVRNHGGEIEAQCNPHGGALFRVRLPLSGGPGDEPR